MNAPHSSSKPRQPKREVVEKGSEPVAPRVVAAEPQSEHRVRVRFEGGEERTFDLSELLELGGFARLRDRDEFERVAPDDVGGGIEWAAGPALSADTLYYGGTC